MTTMPTKFPAGPGLGSVPLSEVEAEEVKFFWNPYIPAGTVTMMFGYGGIGKSWIACDLAARASSGRPLPGHTSSVPPQKVLMVTAEDDAGHVLKPRMSKLEANMNNIFVVEYSFDLDKAAVNRIKGEMAKVEAAIVFLDPIVAFLSSGMDMNRSNETRSILGPLGDAARDTGCAVVVIHHAKKDGKGRALNRMMGSADFTNGVRSVLMVDENRDGQKFLSHEKHNWSRGGKSLEFVIDNDVLRWGGEHVSSRQGLGASPDLPIEHARELLREALAAGPQPAGVVLASAKALGISQGTLNRAKIGITKAENKGGVWWLGLQHPTTIVSPPQAAPSPSDLLSQVGPLPRRLAASLFAPITV